MTKTIYVQLFNEGTVCYRPVDAIELNDGKYKIIEIECYDPENEEWEFIPGSVVNVKHKLFSDGTYGLLAVKNK